MNLRDDAEYKREMADALGKNVFGAEITSEMSYYGSETRTTLDGEWEEEELLGELQDTCLDVLKQVRSKYEGRALVDADLLYDEYLSNAVREALGYDLIIAYNSEADRRKDESLFAIHYFYDKVRETAMKILKDNVVVK